MPATLDKETATKGARLPESSGGRGRGEVAGVAALWAVGLFAALNIVLLCVSPDDRSTSKDLWSGSGSIDLALNDLKSLKKRPDVVLLGSSLMMYPFWAMDKERNAGVPDIFHHHVSETLAGELKARGHKEPTVFSLAIFGQMVSDAYIYVDEFLAGDRKPETVVFGIAPRDFSDFDLPAPMATMTFKRLVGLSNFGRYADLYLPGWQEKADFIAGKACFFYGRRWRLQHEVDRVVDKVYKALGIGGQEADKPKSGEQAGFMLAGSDDERWANSLNEYRRRYRNIGDKDLSIQMGFLERLVATCRDRGIRVVVMNMPLTDVNRRLFPDGFYDSFRARIKAVCDKPGVRLLDLGDCSDFVHADYWDTTHLNHGGGHKLLKHLTPLITAD